MWNKRVSKYGNKKIEHAGRRFDSKLEKAVYDILLLRMKAKEFTEVKQQFTVHMTDAMIGLKVDFRCTLPTGDFLYVEAKGFPTDVWAIKKRLWKYYGIGALEIWVDGGRSGPKLSEVIRPMERTGSDQNHRES